MCSKVFACLFFLFVPTLGRSAPSEDIHDFEGNTITCGGLAPQRDHTACPTSTHTCCQQLWSPTDGQWGCAPFTDATCCGNGYFACPSGYTCQDDNGEGWKVRTACVSDDNSGAQVLPGVEICKPGPPLNFSDTKPNVVILGDSVSIGYTPFVASQLGVNVAAVQHTPWDVRDGGASNAEYGFWCLDRLLSAPDGTPLRPDVLYFNWGLHDCAPGSEPSKVYIPYLTSIVRRLVDWAKEEQPPVKLLFGLTTAWLNNKENDDIIVDHNQKAESLMRRFGIPTVDLHGPIIKKCGEVPKDSCFDWDDCWSPHCSKNGYEWLASTTITPAIRSLLHPELDGEMADTNSQ